MNRNALHFLMSASLLVLASVSGFGQQQPPADPLGFILEAHKAGIYPSPSVQITGTVERDGKIEPFRILATRYEELRVEYGTSGQDTRVSTPMSRFHEDGEKATYGSTPSGFSQLDVTGPFLVEQLRVRAVRAEWTGESFSIAGTPAWRIRIEGGRTEKHKVTALVGDNPDLYVSEGGLLLGISRTFYEGRPNRYTQTFTFSDFRETAEGRLLPFRIEVYIKGKKRQTFLVDAYTLDTHPGQGLFQPGRTR